MQVYSPDRFDLRRVDAVAAEHLDGYVWVTAPGGTRVLVPSSLPGGAGWTAAGGSAVPDPLRFVPRFSSDAQAAWGLLCRRLNIREGRAQAHDLARIELRSDGTVLCRVRVMPGMPYRTVAATTLPLAVCLALLDLWGIDIDRLAA